MGKALVASKTIWMVVGLLATFFLNNEQVFEGFMPDQVYHAVANLLGLFFGAGAIYFRATATQPVTGIVSPNAEKPMTFVKQ
jgi:hypothetical protein